MFKEQMGLSLTNYVYETKLSRLYDDLIHRDESITALMEQNGLKNPRTARKIFVDMYGCLPNNAGVVTSLPSRLYLATWTQLFTLF